MVNPITREDTAFVLSLTDEKAKTLLLGRMMIARASQDEKELNKLKNEIRTLRGDVFLTVEDAVALGTAAKNSEQIDGKTLIAVLSGGREITNAFRTAAGLKKAE